MRMRVCSIALIAAALFAVACGEKQKDFTPAEYVNPFIGASTNTDAAGVYHGLGKTFPGATTPFGMVQVSPNTITGGDNGSGYSYEMKTIEGFAFTQMSGVGWFGDLGNFLVMPTTGKMKTIAGKEDGSFSGWRSHYDKESEDAEPGYYKVFLTDYGIKAETSATPHCGIIRFTFPESDTSRVQIDLARRVGGTSERQYVKVVDENTIEGCMLCTPATGGWGNGEGNALYTVYFHATFSKPLSNYGFWSADIPDGWVRKKDEVVSLPYLQRVAESKIISDRREIEGKHLGFFTEFPSAEGEEVVVKAGISFVDVEGARRNYEAEIADKDFDTVRKDAYRTWNDELSRITVTGGSDADKTVFYTALYHSMIDPRLYADTDGRYVGGDYKVHDKESGFTKRTLFSGWDVYRSQMPLYTIIRPEIVNDMVASLVTLADQSGREYYERWEFLNAYTGCMIGNPALSVLTDAWMKGIRGYDVDMAYQYAINTTEKFGNWPLGWTPGSLSISNTLEYAYFDWCLSQLALGLGKEEDSRLYKQHSIQAYKNIFCHDKGWFRPRNADGFWAEWPDSARTKEWYGCIECNPYQQGWFVPQDIPGMTAIMGGREKVIADLDNFFANTPEDMLWNQYYNHANEPVHFVPFLYNRLGEPWKTQKWSRFICTHAYSDNVPAGLVGNDDAGQMSAWYVLASSGLHPVCPGDNYFEISSPVFEEITFRTDPHYASGKTFTVKAIGNSSKNIYIQNASLDGKPLNEPRIRFEDIAKGGVLELYMGPEPSKWGISNKVAAPAE